MAENRTLFAGGRNSIREHFQFNVESDYHLLFRLSAPEPPGTAWLLQQFLQSKSDPSLLHPLDGRLPPAQAAIAAQKRTAAEKVSTFAGKATAALDAKQAHEFLAENAYALQDAGFTVQIPRGLKIGVPSQLRVGLVLNNNLLAAGRNNDSKLFTFDYRLAIGDTVISEEEFRAIAAAKAPLVSVKGKWVEINPEEVRKLENALAKAGEIASLPQAVQFGFAAAAEGLDTAFISDKRAFHSAFELLDESGCFSVLEPPKGFCGELRPYQKRGAGWLDFLGGMGLGALLADDMGLGKTVQVIAYATKLAGQGETPVLVVCPTSVITNWAREFARFSPKTRVKIHHGSDRSGNQGFRKEAGQADVVITSYALAWRDEEELDSVKWAAVVLDEAQNIKNPLAKQSRRVKNIPAKYRIALTGTPIENRLSDMWSIMEFLNPGFLGHWQQFKERFAKPIESKADEEKMEALRNALSPLVLRRLKTDKKIIRDLPEKTESTEWCTLTPEQATLYQAVVDSSLEKIDAEEGERRRMEVFATITRLKQICNHPANYLKDSRSLGQRSGKVERLRELLDTIAAEGESCLVFSQYTEMASMLCDGLKKESDTPVSYLHGQLSRQQRDAVVNEFQAEGAPPGVLILSLKAGGTGLNLTSANNVIHFDRWWNPAVENQATDRAHRIGQKKNVFVYKLVTRGTIEEKIEDILRRKKDLADSVVGSGESILARMSGKELKKMLELDA
ncbi:DEAD/DEAH box helicase [Candidatus Micrarchaeota archaeon]|nr:DEAD/DEAH box helicase [Candidatus Micrarchaeota archaeon]